MARCGALDHRKTPRAAVSSLACGPSSSKYKFNNDRSTDYDFYNNTSGIHQVVHSHQLSSYRSLGGGSSVPSPTLSDRAVAHSPTTTSRRVEIFVPMNIPQYSRNGALTILFQTVTDRLSLSVSLDKCLDGRGHQLKDAHEIMFPAIDRNRIRILTLVIAWPGYDTLEYPIDIGAYDEPITRAQLARQIAYHFVGFFKLCDTGGFMQTSQFEWKVGGRDGYSFDQMQLSSFWNIEGSSWGASVRVLGHG